MTTPDHLYEKLVNLGTDWADKNAAAELLRENRKSVRAQAALEYIGKAGSVAKAELMADADGGYLAHIRAMVEAERMANIARVNYDGQKIYIDLLRSKEATDRASMTLR